MCKITPKYPLIKNLELFLGWLFLAVCSQGVAGSWAEETLAQMSLEEKVGQLFVIPACQFREEEHKKDLERLIQECHIGGLILKQGTPDGQVMLINHLQEVSHLPLLCIQDAEWGLQMRMADILAFPKNLTLGAIQDNALLYRLGQEIGWQCALVGGHINAAPVVDVNSNPNNPIIHWRSFGDDPHLVAEKGLQMMLGMQSMGILACAKHFPGHGDAAVDSHLDLPQVMQPLERLEEVELLPFRKLIEGGVKTVMSAHVSVPALDGYLYHTRPQTWNLDRVKAPGSNDRKGPCISNTKALAIVESRELSRWPKSKFEAECGINRPATFSPEIIKGLLCSTLHFEGLVISDALNMQAVSRYFDDARIAEHAFEAGHDLLLYGDHLEPKIDRILREQVPVAFQHLVRLFYMGELDLAELDRRVLKVLRAKEDLNLHKQRMLVYDVRLPEMINRQEAFSLKKTLFQEAITLLKNKNDLLPLKLDRSSTLLIEDGDVCFFHEQLYCAQSNCVNLDSAKQSQIEALHSDRRSPSLSGKGKDEDRFGEVAACPNSHNLTGRSIAQGCCFKTHHVNDMEHLDPLVEVSEHSLVIFALSELMLSKELFGIKPILFEWMKICQQEMVPFVIVLFGTPYSLSVIPEADGMIVAYERDKDAQEAAADLILGRIEPHGRLPISILPEYPSGSGIIQKDSERKRLLQKLSMGRGHACKKCC